MSLDEMDIEAFLNIRDWFEAAIVEKGGKIVDSGMGAGKADLGVELEGHQYALSITPRIEGTTEAWENRELGADERYVRVVPDSAPDRRSEDE